MMSLTGSGNERALEIQNVTWQATDQFLSRQTVVSRHIVGDKGQESNVTVEAWKLGVDPKQKPLYTIKAEGTGGRIVDGCLYVVDRGLEEVEWWSIYRLDNGQHLFDTHVPPVSYESRYYGLEIPEGEQGKTIGFLTYSTDQQVKRRVVLLHDDAKQAALLRSYWDTQRTLTYSDHQVKITFQPSGVIVTIPVARDDLDVAHARIPAGMHVR